MKTLYALLLGGILSQPVIAQEIATGTVDPSIPSRTFPANGSLERILGSGIIGSSSLTEASDDTLTQYLDRSTGFALYSYNADPNNPNNQLPITGTNGFYYFLGVKFHLSNSATVKGMLVHYGVFLQNGPADTLAALVFDSQNTDSLPLNQLGGQAFVSTLIDTSSTQRILTYIPFNTPVDVPKDFVALVQTRGLGNSATQPDIMGILSNLQGEGKEERQACFLNVTTTGLEAGNLASLPLLIENQPLDFDPMIFPIVELSASGADAPVSMNGLTLSGAYPNPAVERTSVAVELQSRSDVQVDLVDPTGRIVRSVTARDLPAGAHHIELDLNGLASGSYVYAVTTKNAHFGATLTLRK